MANIFSDEYWNRLYELMVNNDRDAIQKELEALEGKEETHG